MTDGTAELCGASQLCRVGVAVEASLQPHAPSPLPAAAVGTAVTFKAEQALLPGSATAWPWAGRRLLQEDAASAPLTLQARWAPLSAAAPPFCASSPAHPYRPTLGCLGGSFRSVCVRGGEHVLSFSSPVNVRAGTKASSHSAMRPMSRYEMYETSGAYSKQQHCLSFFHCPII